MTLLSPLQLAVAAGVVVPILIHLFGRPRPRLVPFPSLRLLRAAHRERHSSVRVRRLLALILRCLAVMLLALALALPTSRASWLRAIGTPLGRTAIVIDASASMSAGGAPHSAIARARAAAATILEALPPGRSVTLASAASSLRLLGDSDGAATREAASMVEAVRATDERGRLGECLAALKQSLGSGPLDAFLLTDLQAGSLGAPPEGALHPAATITVIDVGALLEGNNALVEASVRDRPALRGRPLRVDVRARTWDAQGAGRVPVSLVLDGNLAASASLALLPDAEASAELEFAPQRAGLLVAEARLPQDDFPPDDRRHVAALVRARLRVVVCGGEEQTRFLRAALDPFPPGDERSTVEVLRADPPDMTEELVRDADAVVVADAARLADAALRTLRDAAVRGTGVLLFAGPDADVDALNLRVLAGLGLAGVELGGERSHEDGLALAELATRRPPLDAFAEPGAGDLAAARFTKTRALAVPGEAGLSVLARFDDGTPALIESTVGRGSVLLFATAPDDAWSDLPRLPVYVPLVHRLVLYLAAGRCPAVLDAAPGETAVGAAPGREGQVRLTGPDGDAGAVEEVAGCLRFVPDRVGTWRLSVEGEDVAAFAVNLDRAESDPARLSTGELQRRLRPAQVTLVPMDRLREALSGLMRPADISGLFALLALILLAVDAVLVEATGAGTKSRE